VRRADLTVGLAVVCLAVCLAACGVDAQSEPVPLTSVSTPGMVTPTVTERSTAPKPEPTRSTTTTTAQRPVDVESPAHLVPRSS
jgi:hypothetical protein